MSDYDDIRNALSYIDSHERDTWIQVGAALKDELGDDGFNLWDNWSQGAANYNARDAKTAWKSFKPGRVHIGTVFYYARQNGYRPDKPYTPPTPEQQAARAAELDARRQEEERAQAEAQAKAKETAQGIWNRSAPARADHPYLIAKGITSAAAVAGLRQNSYRGDDNLVVPLYYDGEIVNVQSINQDGHKRFLSGGQVKGGYAVVGNAGQFSDGIVIAEGYATAASIHQATGKPVIVAFNAGNMVTVSERLAQKLPADVPVMLAVDNDASQTGIHKAQQAAAFFGGRAVAVQPEFTMTQIQAYQKANGLNLPSDFNDLHQLAGIEAVREKVEAAFRRPEPAPETAQTVPAPDDTDWAAVAAEEARLSGYTAPTNAAPRAAENPAASLQEQEAEMPDVENHAAAPQAQPEADPANTIEYAALRQTKEPEPYQTVDPDHVYGSGRTEDRAADQPARADTEREAPGNAPDKTPEPERTAKPEDAPEPEAAAIKKPVTDLNYRIPPESIASRYVVADGKYLSIANHTTEIFRDGGKKISTAKTDMQTINDMLEVAKEKGWDGIKISGSKEFKSLMYVMAESQGIRTSGYRPTKEDLALLERMRQERSLNSIEPQPARTPAVAPEAEKVPPAPYPGDKRQQPSEAPAQTAAAAEVGERIVSIGNAPYQHNPANQDSPYIVLEKDGKERTVWGVDLPDAMERSGAEVGDRIRLHKLGKQPVEIEIPVRDESGKITGMKTGEVHRNLFKMEIVGHDRGSRAANEPVPSKPDVEAISKAEKLMAQSTVPSDAAINTSHAADTQAGVPLQAVGQGEIPSEVAVMAGQMKAAALETRFISAKAAYMNKAAKLSKANRQHLEFHERNVMDTIRGVKGEARTLALANYYEHTAKQMSGTKLKLPKPIQIPTPEQAQTPQVRREPQQQERSQQPEPEIGR